MFRVAGLLTVVVSCFIVLNAAAGDDDVPAKKDGDQKGDKKGPFGKGPFGKGGFGKGPFGKGDFGKGPFGKGGFGKGGFGDPEASFKRLDSNNDGKLSKDEFMKIASFIKDEEKAGKFKEMLDKAFEMNSTNGFMSMDQFKEQRKQAAEKFKGGFKKKNENN